MMTKFVTAFRTKISDSSETTPRAVEKLSDKEVAFESLSAREREIVTFIARGDSNKVIGRHLDIAEATVKVHMQHILRKLQLDSRVQVAVYAATRGLY
jgi:two-component system nitrate/nitrite response regulator NarL